MSIASRISKKTFFAAAALGFAAAVPAQAYLFEDTVRFTPSANVPGYYVSGYRVYKIDTTGLASLTYDGSNTGDWVTFVKDGEGRAQVSMLGTTGGSLYNGHVFGYVHNDKTDDDGAYYFQTRYDGTIQGDLDHAYASANSISNILRLKSGELVVSKGVMNLTGYVNAWYDFGQVMNGLELGQTSGKMVGMSRITVRNGAELDLSGNNNFQAITYVRPMVASNSDTVFQFLHNLQAGDLGSDKNSLLSLGTSTAFHVNIHVDGWAENERIDTGVTDTAAGDISTTMFDSALAFGGSIGSISGNGSIYKTGDGAFTLLGASTGFYGGLYAAGGSLVIDGDSVGTTESFRDAFGNDVRAKVNAAVGNASSVNIAGRFNSGAVANGGSMQGKGIGAQEIYAVVSVTDPDDRQKETIYTAVKESFFTTPSAGTLVISENQSIRNFQSMFAAGYSVASGTSAADAVKAAANNDGVLSPRTSSLGNLLAEKGSSDAPVIAGTGVGSYLVIPGGNYRQDDSGNWVANVDANGYMKGGVLAINQESGKGGVYEGSVVGARVRIYDKTAFDQNTKDNATLTEDAFTNENRKNDVLVTRAKILADAGAIGVTEEEINALNIAADGSFALDNDVAWKIVNYYKDTTASSNTYYVEYEADEEVRGGVILLKGAGDLAFLPEVANYSGIVIDENRTGKTVLNIASVNSLVGSSVTLGGKGTVAFVANQSDTLRVKLGGFSAGTRLVFTTAELIDTLSGSIRVGDSRKAEIGFAQTQEDVHGDVYVERGIGLNLSGSESTFLNASSLTVWSGAAIKDSTTAAPSLRFFEKTDNLGATHYVNQVVNNLTGDSSARIEIGKGVLAVNSTDNSQDAYSGLTRGVYDGSLTGVGSVAKDGTGTFSLGGGDLNRNFTGTVEVAAGTFALTKANGLTGAGALILDSGAKATLSGDQSLRALYGSAQTSVSVEGTLTLGADLFSAAGESRPLVSNNLGTSESVGYQADANVSFARFRNCYDLEGNLVLENNALPMLIRNQKDGTTKYLTAVAKTAYSGFDASVLEKFVGVTDYDGSALLSQADYDAILSYAKTAGRDGASAPSGMTTGTLLSDLAGKYAALEKQSVYLDTFAPTPTSGGYWSPAGMKNLFSAAGESYTDYIRNELPREVAAAYGSDIPSNPTAAQKQLINNALFGVLKAKYDDLAEKSLKKSLLANPTAMFAEFKTAKNLAGTALLSAAEIAALDAYVAEHQDDEDALYAKYAEYKAKTDAVADKSVFAGIAVVGGFAAQVDADGNLTDTSWIENPNFAGTLTAQTFVKSGESAVALTGTLTTQKLVVSAGTLEVGSSTLAGAIPGGVSVARGANLSVSVSGGEEANFNFSTTGEGNFVKTGEGKLTLGDDVKYTGTTTVRGGTLELSLRNPETTIVNDIATTRLAQGDLFFGADDVSLILNQPTEVSWTGNISAYDSAAFVLHSGVSLTKIGDGALTIVGNVALGSGSAFAVEDGSLTISGAFSSGTASATTVSVAKGAALSLGDVTGGSLRFRGEGSLTFTGTASFSGASNDVSEPVPANGQGLSYDAFFGVVTIANGGGVTLSNSSAFAFSRAVNVNGALSVAGGVQTFRALSGSGSVTVSAGAGIEVVRGGDRISADYSSGTFLYNEDALLDAPLFSGRLSGDGALVVSGTGAARFSQVLSNVAVEGGQVVLDWAEGTGYNKTVTVDGSKRIFADASGNKIYGMTAADAAAGNVSSGVASANGYLPRTVVTASGAEVNIFGKTVSSDADGNPVFTDDDGNEQIISSVKDWYRGEGGTLSANWAVLKDGEFVAESDLGSAIVWDSGTNSYVLAADYSAGYRWLAEDANGNLVVADVSEIKELTSEAIFRVASGSAALDAANLSVTAGGKFGKVGDGELTVGKASFDDCGGITVYEGKLTISADGTGNGWVDAKKTIAEGATLSMTIGNGEDPDFTTVVGSGVFELSAIAGATIAIVSSDEHLPTWSADGNYFNGVIRFLDDNGAYDVTIKNVTLAAIDTAADVGLSLEDVTFVQTRDSEIRGTLELNGNVTVEGLSASSGYVLSSDHRRLVVSDLTSAGHSFSLKNVGFGFGSEQSGISVEIDRNSKANAFYVTLATDKTNALVHSSTQIALPWDEVCSLKELSVVVNGGKTFSLDRTKIVSLGAQTSGSDVVFGIDKKVYEKLAANSGTLNIGVEEGVLKLTGLVSAGDGTFFAANGLNVDFVTLRKANPATAGTLVVSDESFASTAAAGTSLVFGETIRGGGNVEFSANGLVVTAKQEYLGKTTVSGDVEFSGSGRQSKTSAMTVTGTLRGGAELLGRNVGYTVRAERNADATGAAGSTTLTLTLSDERLSSDLRCQVAVSSGGVLDASSFAALGSLPEGVTIAADGVSFENGVLTLKVTDAAFGGETYEISVPVDTRAFPAEVGGRTTSAGTTTVAGTFTLASGGAVHLDATAGDLISAGTVTLSVGVRGDYTDGGKLFVENLNSSVRGKALTLVRGNVVPDNAAVNGSTAVVEALRAANKSLISAGESLMKLMVYTDAATGEICAKMITDDFAGAANYSEGISGSFLSALSTIARDGLDLSNPGVLGVINAETLGDGSAKDLFFALNSLTSADLAQEVDKLSPNSYASMLAMPAAAFNSDVARIHARLDQRRYDGANPLRETGEYEFFVLAQSDFAENDTAKDTPIFDYNLYGVSAGFDWKPNFETTLGVALGYTYGKAKMHNGGGKIDMDDVRVTAFFGRLFGNVYLDGGVQAGMGSFDVRRNTVAGPAKGDTDSLFAGAFVTLGSMFTLWQDKRDGEGLYFTPSVGLSYFHTSIDGFRESGTAGLDTDDMDGDSLRARIALGLQWVIPGDEWTVRLGLEAAYAHDFLGDEMDADARFVAGGPKFSTTGKALPQDVFSLGPTIDVQISDRDSLWLGYELEIDTDSGISQGVNVGYRHRF